MDFLPSKHQAFTLSLSLLVSCEGRTEPHTRPFAYCPAQVLAHYQATY